MLETLGAWLLVTNLLAFGAYYVDKRRAMRGQRRIPERTLLGLSAIGGSPAAYLAMRMFRHKTVKVSFRLAYWSIVAVQVGLLVWWFGFREGGLE